MISHKLCYTNEDRKICLPEFGYFCLMSVLGHEVFSILYGKEYEGRVPAEKDSAAGQNMFKECVLLCDVNRINGEHAKYCHKQEGCYGLNYQQTDRD